MAKDDPFCFDQLPLRGTVVLCEFSPGHEGPHGAVIVASVDVPDYKTPLSITWEHRNAYEDI